MRDHHTDADPAERNDQPGPVEGFLTNHDVDDVPEEPFGCSRVAHPILARSSGELAKARHEAGRIEETSAQSSE